ncbi:pre-peptidase C-terminal domain-containing protein [Okeania sp.]|uniref:pre-peptidase C-terminal domain-containing protein n=1 Tax=Okeania sp. TaxID=3100323 RepID=UPI002B4AC4E0|nr:pre-peptidase C-terminal domain-containing protein [Okeania sp.]MEB3340663.1 pre-peptidase C-terminal domain-containing protein [Okeania sp.]
MAEILQGSSNGSWGKADPGPNPSPKLYPGDPDTTFRWGKPAFDDLEPNGLIFTGGSFTGEIGEQFEIGKLNYFNGSIYVETAVESVPLEIELDLDVPTDETTTFTFDLDLDTTLDTSDDIDLWSDFVYFPEVLPSETFNIDGKKYTLELTGFSKDGGETLENRFRVREQEADVASLFGKITKAPIGDVKDPNAYPEGAVDIGDLNKRTKEYRNTEEIGFTEGGIRDLQDFYSFSLSKESEVDITLDQLKQNANVEIVDGDGSTVLFQSVELNRKKENITENLEPGEYFIRVYPEGDDRTKYRLGVNAEALDNEKDEIATAKDLGNIGLEEVTELDRVGFGKGKNRDEQDYYKFSLNEKSDFFLTLDQLKGNANVEVLDDDGTTVLYQSLNSSRKAEKIREELNPGDYYVRVFPQGSAKTDYRLGLSANPMIDEQDDKSPGIDLGTVTELTPVGKTDKLGSNKDQVDWYNFTIPVESDVNITLNKLRADLNIEVFDDGGEIVDDSTNTGKKTETIELEELDAGTYTVKVSQGKAGAKSNYRLGITAAVPYVDDYPTPEESLDLGLVPEGETIVFNNEMGRTVGRSGRDERDWIKFEVSEESFVDINLGRLRQDLNMTLYDDDGATVLNNARSKSRKSENLGVFLEEGTYYVEVKPQDNQRSDYRFSVNIEGLPDDGGFEVGDLLAQGGSYSKLGEKIGFTSSGIRNVVDRYKFTLTEESDVEIDLTGLKADANLALYSDDGTFLRDSRQSGRSNENISDTLETGDYYVYVTPQGNTKTKYDLDIFATGAGPDLDGGPVPETSLYNDIGTLTEDYSKFENVGFGTGTNRDEVDFYRFILSEEKTLNITLENLTDNINLELLDNSGATIFDSRNSGKKNEQINEDLDPGTYYIGVEPQGSARGAYNLNITGAGSGSSIDPDGGKPPENVNDIGVLTAYEESDTIGFTTSYRDVNDYRKFTLSQESKVDINLTNLNANADLELLDSDGLTLLNRSAKGGSTDEKINTTLEVGDYYVRVLPKGAAKTSYQLNMSANGVGGTEDDTPPGISLGTVTDSLTQGGNLGFGSDTNDYYNFDVATPGFVSVALDGLIANADLELYDSTGNVLIGSSTNSGSTAEEIDTFLNADTYVVRVFGQGNQTFYDLSVSI